MTTPSWANERDRERGPVLAAREADWRVGPVVYHVFVDRFAPSDRLEAKRALYAPPRRLRAWGEPPNRGDPLEDWMLWTHELDFYGGDLPSVQRKLDYVQQLGADVLYLNPIHAALTNHKYDATDYFAVAPEYGTRDDLRALATACQTRGMHLVLDGVFNHVGRACPWFQEALRDPASPYRAWFRFDADRYERGYLGWANVGNLPELRLEHPDVQARIFGDADSVVQGYLRDGVAGWRLDVAFDLGFVLLERLRAAARQARPDALVVGEVWNYPGEWCRCLDGILNFYYRDVITYLIAGQITGAHAGRLIERMVADTGIEGVLRSWNVLDNHDTARLKYTWPEQWQQQLAQVLQFTLPGGPCLYYGVEVGLDGSEDPENRVTMDWSRVQDEVAELHWTRELLEMRRRLRALRIGDFELLDSERLLAFMRRTDRVDETVIVVANASPHPVADVLPARDEKLANGCRLRDELGEATFQVGAGVIPVTVEPRTIHVLRLARPDSAEYDAFKRVQ